MNRQRMLGAAALALATYGAACSFPDVAFAPDEGGGSDATLVDGMGDEVTDAGWDGVVGDGSTMTVDSSGPCGATEKRCGIACVSKLDPSHGCGSPSCEPCSGAAHGTSDCDRDSGACIVRCDQLPWQDCDKDASDGCEADPTSGDPENCGGCGKTCDGGFCNAGGGTCSASCEAGTACGKACVDTTKDPNHCGGCDVACDGGRNTTASCDASTCAFACTNGWADCNKGQSDGCESNVKGSTDHCGSCNHPCDGGPFTGSTCDDGACVYGCLSGHNDCNGTLSDGCECAGGPACPGKACTTNADCCGGLTCKTLNLTSCLLNLGCGCY